MKPLLGVLLFAIVFAAAGVYLQRHNPHPTYHSLCRIVEQGHYTQDNRLKSWAQDCKARAQEFAQNPNQHHELLLQNLRNELSLLGGSHLELYEPAAHVRMWTSKSVGDTGLRARFIEGELIVYEVIPESAGAQAKIALGTIIKEVGGEHPNEVSVESFEGQYLIKRPGRSTEENIELKPTALTLDEAPKVTSIDQNLGYLRVPSFRGEFFADEKWDELSNELESYDQVILDLRSNLGGNLIAGMRLLGLLLCGEKNIGYLVKGYGQKKQSEEPMTLRNDLSDRAQLGQISVSKRVNLQSFVNKPCERPQVTVLIDHNSSSTAEIVALALREQARTKIMGTPSAGQVLIAVWYDFSELGEGYSISVPERRYVSKQGQELEGVGVQPDVPLYYRLSDALQGRDSWIQRAQQEMLTQGLSE